MTFYLDSCLVIYWVEQVPGYVEAVEAAIRQHAGATLCISDLVRLETQVGPMKRSQSALLARFHQAYGRFTVLPIPTAVFDLAAEVRARHGLKTPDALHAACAIHHGCDELWTNDARLSALGARLATRVVR